MAGLTHTITRACNDGTATPLSVIETVTSGSDVSIDETIPQSQTDLVVACAFARLKLKSFYIKCDKAISVAFYNDVTLHETITLTAGQAIQWTLADASLLPLPFAADVTSIKVTTGAVGNAQLQLRCLVDPT
jgi:hypothetical protein